MDAKRLWYKNDTIGVESNLGSCRCASVWDNVTENKKANLRDNIIIS